MATTLATLEAQVRINLNAPAATDLFWTSAEIIFWLNQGAKDLWKALKDLYQKHHYTIDQTNISLPASSNALTGVPADVQDIYFIRARTPSSYPNLRFYPCDYGSPVFESALALSAQDSTQMGLIFYDIVGQGGPVQAPTVKIAPQTNAAILLEVGYVPVIGNQTSGQSNPIPGESDAALIAYATAWSRAKERPDKMPDPGWLAVYGTEKQDLIVAMTPRQLQEPEVVVGMFEGWDD
jgi:hypothetical protein